MFLNKREKKLNLLYPENVLVNCRPEKKEDIIRKIGQILVDTGYVDQNYVEAMLKREETVPTYMGNGLALPHGVEEAKKAVKQSGIAVMTFPEGTDWDGETARIVVAVAGVGEEHLEILGNIAGHMMDDESVEELVNGSAEQVYEILRGGTGK